ncbi:MAG TPA: phosphoribosyltransferase [Xanthomonadales bacterium]|nr:phosphoribosyltransferase [Xanthomonadales bacterium]
MSFLDRQDAGRRLAQALLDHALEAPLVLALPRGGVPVAAEVARTLGAPLDVFLVRKLGVPGHEELAFGAIASGGVRVFNEDIVRMAGLGAAAIERVSAEQAVELERRARLYRGDRPAPDVRGRSVLLVDDGLATGATMRAAVRALRELGPERIVVAVPVGSTEACAELATEADDVVCLETPRPFLGVGAWYRDFDQTTDAEVVAALADAASARTTPRSTGSARPP